MIFPNIYSFEYSVFGFWFFFWIPISIPDDDDFFTFHFILLEQIVLVVTDDDDENMKWENQRNSTENDKSGGKGKKTAETERKWVQFTKNKHHQTRRKFISLSFWFQFFILVFFGDGGLNISHIFLRGFICHHHWTLYEFILKPKPRKPKLYCC